MTKGRGLVLLSGGFDSPVAAALAIEAGAELSAVHFSYYPVTGRESEEKAEQIAGKLSLRKIYIANIADALKEIAGKTDRRLYFIFSKILMLRVAERIAPKEKADFLLTGESLGQVSSQTLQHLALLDRWVSIPVIRPLIGLDKAEIIKLSGHYGLYEISKGPELCDCLGPKHPATKASSEAVSREESKVDFSGLVKAVAEKAEERKLS